MYIITKGCDSMNPILRSCIHTHSTFCDGKDAPEAMVQRALALQFLSLGFSGHGIAPYDEAAMTAETEPLYRAEIHRLQQVYDGQLEIFLGLEHDALSPYPDFPYDYMIESVHYLLLDGTYRGVDWSPEISRTTIDRYFGGDPLAYSRYYYQVCAAAYEKTPAQIVGHLDLLTKFCDQGVGFDETDPRYLEPAKEALAVAVERDMLVEVNTGAIGRGYRMTPYPSPALLRHLHDLGGRVMLTSDCHNKDFLNCHYPESLELLKACGFDHAWVLRKTGFEAYAI